MTLQGQCEFEGCAEREREGQYGFPTRIAAAIAILAALTFVDATPRLALEVVPETPRSEESDRVETARRARNESDATVFNSEVDRRFRVTDLA